MGVVLYAADRFDRELAALKAESLRDLTFWLDEATPECWRFWNEATVIEIPRRDYPLDPLCD